VQAICEDIVNEDNRAAAVIRRLTALYKRGDVKLVPLDLNELVAETLKLLRSEMLTRHVAVVAHLATPARHRSWPRRRKPGSRARAIDRLALRCAPVRAR
jgi:hypothetical protein